jgi:hypothetical protein
VSAKTNEKTTGNNPFRDNEAEPEKWPVLSNAQRFERIALELSAAETAAREGNPFVAGVHVGRAWQFAIVGRIGVKKRGPNA